MSYGFKKLHVVGAAGMVCHDERYGYVFQVALCFSAAIKLFIYC